MPHSVSVVVGYFDCEFSLYFISFWCTQNGVKVAVRESCGLFHMMVCSTTLSLCALLYVSIHLYDMQHSHWS